MDTREDYLKITGISKRYGVVRALDDVTFSVKKGEIHALLGENGAGKSTLVKIIKGEIKPDCGSIELEGKQMQEYTPQYSQDMGIQMVHQELAVFENLTVTENLFPWIKKEMGSGWVKWKKYYEKAQKVLDSFSLKTISPSQRMDTVNLAGQQMIEILRCINAQPKVLLLDEPTSGLNNEEADRLMETLHDLRNNGLTIIYISHRLNEIMELADRVTIMRDGKYVTTLNRDEMTEQKLINNMVGRELSGELYQEKEYADISKEVLLEVKHLKKRKVLEDSSFCLYNGEVLGFFGLEGSGTDKLSRMMYGLESSDEAEIWFEGKKLERINSTEMVNKGMLYLNGNRKYAGLLHDMSVTDNIAMPQLKLFSNKWTFLQNKKLGEKAKEFVDKFSIAIPSLKTCPRNMSGGNQQKVMLAICIAANPKLLVVNDPTRGIDVGAKVQIHNQLKEIAEQGVGIIVFSSELPELLSLCDRIIVMHEKKINGEIVGKELSEQAIMRFASVSRKERIEK